ncbi:MAG: hypothetical protein LBU35_01085 [Holosporales bacterium]|jgi:iron-sulfur cluster assembly accessory protein|nr:hypothetical protein [Holosporales bacterium]
MKIEISKEAKEIIQNVMKRSNKYPRIIFKKSGCAGGMFVLTLDCPGKDDIIVEVEDVQFYIEPQILQYSNNISIVSKTVLEGEITVINNSTKHKCKCGKSFVPNTIRNKGL